MVRLNPDLGINAVLKTPGIVLIDEVDMHLHPSWQQTVLYDLRKAFPLVQFIVTTHSPQVLTTVPPQSIRALRWNNDLIDIYQPDFSLGRGKLSAAEGYSECRCKAAVRAGCKRIKTVS